jgi:plasmid stability protein
MADMTINDLPDEVLELIQRRAFRKGRSFEGEFLEIIAHALATPDMTFDELNARMMGSVVTYARSAAVLKKCVHQH